MNSRNSNNKKYRRTELNNLDSNEYSPCLNCSYKNKDKLIRKYKKSKMGARLIYICKTCLLLKEYQDKTDPQKKHKASIGDSFEQHHVAEGIFTENNILFKDNF